MDYLDLLDYELEYGEYPQISKERKEDNYEYDSE